MPDLEVLDAPPQIPAPESAPLAARRRRWPWRPMLITALLAVGALAMIFPFVWTLITSISGGGNVLSTPHLIPEHPSVQGYRTLFADLPFWRILVNSLGLAIVSTILLVGTSAMAPYAFARLEFPGKNVVFVGYLTTLMIPM